MCLHTFQNIEYAYDICTICAHSVVGEPIEECTVRLALKILSFQKILEFFL